METILGNRKNIVILGAGYGGLRTALRLEKLIEPVLDHRITLVDQNRHHQLVTQLHEVAGGRTPAEAIALPLEHLLGMRHIDLHQARVTGVDLDRRAVLTDRGELGFDYLVAALGSETNYYNIPGLREHSFPLKSLGDACLVHGHIHEMLAWAAKQNDRQARREALTFVVGGGGFTGVELAAELAESLPRLARRYGLLPDEPELVIIEAGNAILPGLDPRLVERATRALQRQGIGMILGNAAQSADARGVVLASGQRVASRTVIWTGGVRAPESLEKWGFPTGPAGRIRSNDFLEVAGIPGVYVVGDNALVIDEASKRPAAPSAQLAVAQGDIAAHNIHAAMLAGERKTYRTQMAGEAVSLGARNGVAWVGPLRLSGVPARWLKSFIAKRYLWETGGFQLIRTRAALSRDTVLQDFPQCLAAFRPGTMPAETRAAR